MQPESYPVVMREKAFSAPVLSSSKRRKKNSGFAKWALSVCEMHHIRTRNAPYRGLKEPISQPEMGSFANP